MRVPPRSAWLALLLPAAGAIAQQPWPRHSGGAENRLVARITTVVPSGGRLDWSPQNRIAFDRLGTNGYFDVYTMNPDGSGERCLTCTIGGVPPGHRGNPAWHPSGRYIVFQGQLSERQARLRGGLERLADYMASPGVGWNNTLFVMDSEGRQAWQLFDVRRRVGGVLHPHFSHRGDRLFWTERIAMGGKYGIWTLKVADFRVLNGVPRVENVRAFQPGRQHRFYESFGFSPDDRKVIFSANAEPGEDEFGIDIYIYDLATQELRNLTNTPDQWDEHGHFSPDGRKIVWMSTRDLPFNPRVPHHKMDYWIMNADGSGQQRLTWFNDPAHAEFLPGRGVFAADIDWSPDGRSIMAYLILDVVKNEGPIVRIDLR